MLKLRVKETGGEVTVLLFVVFVFPPVVEVEVDVVEEKEGIGVIEMPGGTPTLVEFAICVVCVKLIPTGVISKNK